MTEFREGDVLDWEPESRWCKEGVAIVEKYYNGSLVAVDTFWGGGDRHILRGPEIATATVRCNLADYDEFDRAESAKGTNFGDYHPDDRMVVTRQHGLTQWRFTRKGAKPDHDTRVERFRAEVEKHEKEMESATWHLEWARKDLARVEAEGEAA